MAETPPRHDKKTFKKASYSASFENQKGFLAERQKVQPFLKTGSLTEKSLIRKRKKKLERETVSFVSAFHDLFVYMILFPNKPPSSWRKAPQKKKEKQKSQFVPPSVEPPKHPPNPLKDTNQLSQQRKNRNPNHRAPKTISRKTHKWTTHNTKKASVSADRNLGSARFIAPY